MERAVPLVAAMLLLLAGAASAAEEIPVASLAETIRFDPHGRSAGIALSLLADRGPAGWKTLGSLVRGFEEDDALAAERAARALAAGDGAERLAVVRSVYTRVRDESLRAILALGLARAYPAEADLLHRRLRENAPGAVELLRALAVRKAVEETLLVFGRDGAAGLPPFPRNYETCTLALLAMALRMLDPIFLFHFDLDTGKAFLDASDRRQNGRPSGEPKVVEAKR